MRLLIDGDVVAYRCAAAAEEPTHWGDDFWTLHADAKAAKERVDDFIANLKDTLGATEVSVFLSPGTNFRQELWAGYKAHRKDVRKPMILPVLKEYLFHSYGAICLDRLEADDVIGIYATSPLLGGPIGEKVIVSIDKDFKTVPGLLYNFNNPEVGIVTVTKEEAHYYHMLQTLMGDTTDGYKGCPGIGEVKAMKILEDEGTMYEGCLWDRVLGAFTKAGLGSSEALLQARLAFILQAGHYVNATNKIKLWTPTKVPGRA